MNFEIEIGRNVDGNSVCLVPPECIRVSRRHATIRWQDGMATIEDLGSTNGTFVNGKRITSSQICEGDTVWLGGKGPDNKCYQLDLKTIFASFPSETSKPVQRFNSEDYSKEFEYVKQAYIDYHTKLLKLTSKTNMKMQLPRVMLSTIPAILGLILMLKYGGSVGFIAISAGTVLSGLIGTLTMGKNSKKQDKLSEEILDLQLKYQKLYKCPKCGKPCTPVIKIPIERSLAWTNTGRC